MGGRKRACTPLIIQPARDADTRAALFMAGYCPDCGRTLAACEVGRTAAYHHTYNAKRPAKRMSRRYRETMLVTR